MNADHTYAEQQQARLDAWAAQAAACLIDQRPDLAQLCLDELACIRRETVVDWEATPCSD